MWMEGGGESTAWPGVAATLVGKNDIGEDVYSVTVDSSVYDYVIFNGSGGQTADVSVAEAAAAGCGLYCLDTTDSQGHYNVGFYEFVGLGGGDDPTTAPVDPTTAEPTTAQPTQGGDGETYTLYFSNNKGWSSVNVYMWMEGGGESTAWPGVAATLVGKNDIGEDVYSVTVDSSVYDYVIFNGSGGQTADVSVAEAAAAGCGLYCLDTTDSQGHFNVGMYEFTGLGEGGNTDPTQGGNTDPTQGGNTGSTTLTLNAGQWDKDGARFAAYFFGNGETWVDMSSSGNSIYTVTVPDGYSSVIFCRMNGSTTDNTWNNKWNQTSDLSVSDGIGKTYYITGWDNSGYWG